MKPSLPLSLSAACLAIPCAAAAPAPAPHQLVLSHATVVDVREGRLLPGRTIIVDDGRIRAIVPDAQGKGLRAGRAVDLAGRYVTPGFSDMHVHIQNVPDPHAALDLMLANGITSYRLMSGSPELLQQRKAGRLFAWPDMPDLLAMPGTILTRANAATPDAARAEVDRQAAQGADFIKVIDVTPDSYFAALDESKREHLPYIGHLPPQVDVWKASNDGVREIEHLGPNAELVVGCSSQDEALDHARFGGQAQPPAVLSPQQNSSLKVMPGNPVILNPLSDMGFIHRVIATFDEARCRKLAATFVARQTWQTPTLIRLHTMEHADDPALAKDPDLHFVSSSERAQWAALTKLFTTKFSVADRQDFRRLLALQARIAKLFDQAGVPMLAGSDAGGAGWEVPGFALHREFDELARAGLPPLSVLRMTTINPAKLLGRTSDFGEVAPGRVANLVILRADPLRSASNLHGIADVVLHGRLFDEAALDRLKGAAKPADRGPAIGRTASLAAIDPD